MSGALGNNGGRIYSFGNQPVLIDCNFVVDSTNGNGLGVRNLKGQGVKSVKMASSAGAPAGTPALGAARAYAVLGASAVTNTGSSVLTGNLGISPGTAVTGFPPGVVSGVENVANVAAAQAQAAALAAYTDLHARASSVIATALDGQTLTPGVYSSAGGTFTLAQSAGGTVTLNGAGVYVFQTATTLTTGAGGVPVIALTGGARASDVYWVVGSSATINSGSAGTFQGNIIALTSITDTLGGTVNGSLIALNGAVTLSAATTGVAQSLSVPGVMSPGLAWIELSNNYNRYLGGFSGFVSPVAGSPIAINSTNLVVGNPYVIASVGVGPAGRATISPVADVSGSLAGKYFMLYDSYGNAFCIYLIVNGIGSRPNLGLGLTPQQLANGARGLSYQPLVLATGASAATQTTALSTLINALPSGVQGVSSFTTSGGGGATLTVISTQNAPLAGIPQDGSSVIAASNGIPLPINFTISSGSATAGSVWTDGSGNLYTVSATVSSGTLLQTMGTQSPSPLAGTLTFVSGTGSTTALNYSAAVAGFATGYSFALTVNDTNLQDWNAIGLPKGLTPAVGQSFVAKASGAGGSTGLVIAPGVSGVNSIEVIGDPNLSLAPQAQGGSPNVGGWILAQMLSNGVPTAPVDGSVCGMSFYVDAKLSPSNINSH